MAAILLRLGMTKKDLPPHTLIGSIVMGIIAVWLIVYMVRAYVL